MDSPKCSKVGEAPISNCLTFDGVREFDTIILKSPQIFDSHVRVTGSPVPKSKSTTSTSVLYYKRFGPDWFFSPLNVSGSFESTYYMEIQPSLIPDKTWFNLQADYFNTSFIYTDVDPSFPVLNEVRPTMELEGALFTLLDTVSPLVLHVLPDIATTPRFVIGQTTNLKTEGRQAGHTG